MSGTDVWVRALPPSGSIQTERVEWAVNYRYARGRTWQDAVWFFADNHAHALQLAAETPGARVMRRTVTDWVEVPA